MLRFLLRTNGGARSLARSTNGVSMMKKVETMPRTRKTTTSAVDFCDMMSNHIRSKLIPVRSKFAINVVWSVNSFTFSG